MKSKFNNAEELFNYLKEIGLMSLFDYQNYLQNHRKHVYVARYFRQEHFEKIMIDSKLIFVKPELWDDPMENIFLKKSEIKNRWMGANLYGLCWSTDIENNDKWKEYCKEQPGVRVFTDIVEICNAIISHNNIYRGKDLYSGVVQYMHIEEIMKFVESDFMKSSNSSSDTAKTRSTLLFLKDELYRWECEYRIVFEDQKTIYSKEKFYPIEINLNKFIKKVEIDPRMNMRERKRILRMIRKKRLMCDIHGT